MMSNEEVYFSGDSGDDVQDMDKFEKRSKSLMVSDLNEEHSSQKSHDISSTINSTSANKSNRSNANNYNQSRRSRQEQDRQRKQKQAIRNGLKSNQLKAEFSAKNEAMDQTSDDEGLCDSQSEDYSGKRIKHMNGTFDEVLTNRLFPNRSKKGSNHSFNNQPNQMRNMYDGNIQMHPPMNRNFDFEAK